MTHSASAATDLEPPDAESVTANVRQALAEDVGTGDISARLVDATARAHAEIITRSDGVFCGRPWVRTTCEMVDPDIVIAWSVADGERVTANQKLFELSGPARGLLTAERTLLNFVQLLSGTATVTRSYVDLIGHGRSRILDTRKTIPGLRAAQKYAVRCGGGYNHRMGLFDAFLIKENHILAAGSLTAAVAGARRIDPASPVEVEVETLEELDEAIAAGADIAMLDNFSPQACADAVDHSAGRLKLEASGGIDSSTIADYAATGVDYISVGDLTKHVRPLDLSMRFSQCPGQPLTESGR